MMGHFWSLFSLTSITLKVRLAKVVIVCYATDHGFVGTLEALVEPPVHQGQQWFEPKPASMKTEPTSPLTVQGSWVLLYIRLQKTATLLYRLEHQPQNLHESAKRKNMIFESN